MATPPDLLKATCDTAYDQNKESCSHAVWHVIKTLVNAKEPYRQANELINYMQAGGWSSVTLEDGYATANQGLVVVGGLKADKHGHVIVIYPGSKKLNGGYQYKSKKTGKLEMLKGKAQYPLCLSTSSGQWPGAKSRGTLTVWDPWGNDAVFAKVRFWTPGLPLYVNAAAAPAT